MTDTDIFLRKSFNPEDLSAYYTLMTGEIPIQNRTGLEVFLEHESISFKEYNLKFFQSRLSENTVIIPDSSVYFVPSIYANINLSQIPIQDWGYGYPDKLLLQRELIARVFREYIMYDGFFAFVLSQKKLVSWNNLGVISFHPENGILKIDQIQGKSNQIKNTNMPKSLLTYTLDWASSIGIPAVAVRNGTNHLGIYEFLYRACSMYKHTFEDYFSSEGKLNLKRLKEDFPDEQKIIKELKKKAKKEKKTEPLLIGPNQAFCLYDITSIMVGRHSPYEYSKLRQNLYTSVQSTPVALKNEHLFVTNPTRFDILARENNWTQFL
jgi:hypothetical protein